VTDKHAIRCALSILTNTEDLLVYNSFTHIFTENKQFKIIFNSKMPTATPPTLRVAIIGGGPGGLATAIALSALPNIEVVLYEQARELREIGAGIRIGFNCWKVLELLGAAEGVKGHQKIEILHRNGLTGEIINRTGPPNLPLQYQPRRVRRNRLQSALKAKVPQGIVRLNKRLVSLTDVENGGVKLIFEDGSTDSANLVVGGDGIRSVVRQHAFPDHAIKFTGTTIWRVLIPYASVSKIADMGESTSWWHGPTGHFYSSLVDDPLEVPGNEQLFEIAARSVVDPETATGKRFSWGVPATNERVLSHFTNFDPRVREALEQVPEGQWKEFSAFAGPHLSSLTAWNKIVLIGDASHPLSGAFGSGAAFALEDAWILTRAIEHTRSLQDNISKALEIFDSIRSPYYLRMYEHLDQQKINVAQVKIADPSLSFAASLEKRVEAFGGVEKLNWIYGNNIKEVWIKFIEGEGAT
jgi:salicylate hydroxylase